MAGNDGLIPVHGGYRRLKSFQLAQLVYDATIRFCDLFVGRRSRTHDQMVQAARSGVQNIAEGSVASGTSRKSELKLTNVARASLEELRLDYEDFLRQRGLPQWPPSHPALARFRSRRCSSMKELLDWEKEELELLKKDGQTRTGTDKRNQGGSPVLSVTVRDGPCSSVYSQLKAQLQANALLSLLNLCCWLLDRQVAAQAAAFEQQGGFTERLYRVRSERRSKP